MSGGLILAIDQGTTNTKALLVDSSGAPSLPGVRTRRIDSLTEGFVEQDPIALWDSLRKVIASAFSYAAQSGSPIEALAISNQRETAIAWERETGEPVANAISWQCTRSAEICHRLECHQADVSATGRAFPWLRFLRREVGMASRERRAGAKRLRDGSLRLGTVDTWLIHQLTGGLVACDGFFQRIPNRVAESGESRLGYGFAGASSGFLWQRCRSCKPPPGASATAAASTALKAYPYSLLSETHMLRCLAMGTMPGNSEGDLRDRLIFDGSDFTTCA